jgi:hypothetical protein
VQVACVCAPARCVARGRARSAGGARAESAASRRAAAAWVAACAWRSVSAWLLRQGCALFGHASVQAPSARRTHAQTGGHRQLERACWRRGAAAARRVSAARERGERTTRRTRNRARAPAKAGSWAAARCTRRAAGPRRADRPEEQHRLIKGDGARRSLRAAAGRPSRSVTRHPRCSARGAAIPLPFLRRGFSRCGGVAACVLAGARAGGRGQGAGGVGVLRRRQRAPGAAGQTLGVAMGRCACAHAPPACACARGVCGSRRATTHARRRGGAGRRLRRACRAAVRRSGCVPCTASGRPGRHAWRSARRDLRAAAAPAAARPRRLPPRRACHARRRGRARSAPPASAPGQNPAKPKNLGGQSAAAAALRCTARVCALTCALGSDHQCARHRRAPAFGSLTLARPLCLCACAAPPPPRLPCPRSLCLAQPWRWGRSPPACRRAC